VLLGHYTASEFVTASDGKRRHAHHVRDRDAAGGTSVKQCDRRGRSRPDGGRGKRADAASRICQRRVAGIG